MDRLALLARLARPGEAAVHLAAQDLVAALPAASLAVREGVAWRREAGGAWRATDEPAWEAMRAFLRGPGWRVALLGYDAGRLVERLPSLARDDTRLPQVLLHRFEAAYVAGDLRAVDDAAGLRLAERAKADPPPRAAGRAGPLAPSLPRARFERMVHEAKAHVRAGDVFQVNLSHRLEGDCDADPVALYARLARANPAPHAAFLQSGPLPEDAEGFVVLSASPERLVRVADGRIEARPIAGTRPRGADPEEDAALVEELRRDGKEQAEHAMMVDLARNDLGRVAAFGSVCVPRLADVETYRSVHHLVSTVEARLRPGADAVDVVRALFPGATITGAPKVRAMEVIEALEPVRRGVYTGSLGALTSEGELDLNILIRTFLLRRGRLHLQVGAGIVEESDPAREWDETLAKAKGMLLALEDVA
ncbi:MAG: para-aminobenzoate synthetase component [Thermoplasmata archaeon]|jgi:para-aminobenzoate synthetase component 1|nr:para-aminobenzoate synthetase component [Thermoplasmata archaeon]